MTLRQAKQLRAGDMVSAIVESPCGGESRWDTEKRDWVYEPVLAGQVLVFQGIIPKVRIVKYGPWHDGLDEMLCCKTLDGRTAWLNIGNAKKQKTAGENIRKMPRAGQ